MKKIKMHQVLHILSALLVLASILMQDRFNDFMIGAVLLGVWAVYNKVTSVEFTELEGLEYAEGHFQCCCKCDCQDQSEDEDERRS